MRTAFSLTSLLCVSWFFIWVHADYTYWVDSSCKDKDNGAFIQALDEVIWSAGRVVEKIERNDRYVNDVMQWFFNFAANSREAEFVQKTFTRVSQLKKIDDHEKSHLRIFCDNDARFKRLGQDGTLLPSDPTAPIVQATKYYDEINDSFILGARLECQVDKSSDCLAHTFPRIYSDNERIRLPEFPRQPGQFSQPNDRVSITFCDSMFLKNRKPNFPFTARAFARIDLENAWNRPYIAGNLAFTVITHELIHVPFLSSQSLSYPIVNDRIVGFHDAHGKDRHGPRELTGYYRRGNTDLPGPHLDIYEYTVMNPDSYAYVNLYMRLLDKQWEPYMKDINGEPTIRVRKNLDLEEEGDWPNAPPLQPLIGSSIQPGLVNIPLPVIPPRIGRGVLDSK